MHKKMRQIVSKSFTFGPLSFGCISIAVPALPTTREKELGSKPAWSTALLRGFRSRCPSCGGGAIFGGYVRVNQHCDACGLELGAYRSDDAPAYFTIAIVGHFIVAGMLILEQASHPATWVHMVTWLPLTLAMTLVLLPRIKGALLGAQWILRIKA
jgi:uncharacterized protein (DUF983 family)